MPEADKEKHTEASITAMLASKYSGSDWAFCSKVPNGTGMQKDRTADGLAMSLWPSKGLHLHGFEIKVSRSDWLKEIQDVSKAAAFSRYCHYWWVVAPKGIVKLEEMPGDWGLIEAGKSLRNKKAATLRDPENPDHALLAGIFRACNKQDDNMNAIAAARREGYRQGCAETEKRFEKKIDPDAILSKRKLERLQSALDEFEKRSGVSIDEWSGRSIGDDVNLARRLRNCVSPQNLNQLQRSLLDSADRCGSILADFERLLSGNAKETE